MTNLVFLLVVLLLSAYCDYKHRKIPNAFVAAGLLAGLFRLLILEDVITLLFYLPGIILPVFLLFPVYKIGGIGAGDIKLFSMIGMYFPVTQLLFIIFTTLFLGALLAFIKMSYYHNFSIRMEYLMTYLKESFTTGKFEYYHRLDTGEIETIKIRLTIPILLSVLIIGGIYG